MRKVFDEPIPKNIMLTIIFYGFSFLLIIIFLVKSIGGGIDKSIDNENIMLCHSAEVSGNSEYLKKCQKFYETGDITYLRGE